MPIDQLLSERMPLPPLLPPSNVCKLILFVNFGFLFYIQIQLHKCVVRRMECLCWTVFTTERKHTNHDRKSKFMPLFFFLGKIYLQTYNKNHRVQVHDKRLKYHKFQMKFSIDSSMACALCKHVSSCSHFFCALHKIHLLWLIFIAVMHWFLRINGYVME